MTEEIGCGRCSGSSLPAYGTIVLGVTALDGSALAHTDTMTITLS